jgi:DNA-binding protein H-NS
MRKKGHGDPVPKARSLHRANAQTVRTVEYGDNWSRDRQMAKTYQQIQSQIKALEREAEALREREVRDVVGRIKEAIRVYGLTARDLGFGGARAASAARGKAVAVEAAPRKDVKKGKVPVKFRDGTGNTWTGRGSRPRWLRAAIEAGRKLEEFAV